jgi:type II secretory pathway pseudopilin PulG
MVASAAIIGGAALVGTAGSMYASNRAATAQRNAARDAAAAQEQAYARQEELQEPFRQAGMAAQNRYMTLLGLQLPEGAENVPGLKIDTSSPDYGKYARDFSMADYTADPGYGFRMSEGMKALERSAAARGGLLSGATLKGVQRFGQDLASQEYQNAFNRYQVNRANQLNPLQSLYGGGQTSANVLSNAAGQTGQGLAGSAMAGGQATASGYLNMASALNQGLSTGANLYMQGQYLGGVNELNRARAAYYGRQV